MRNLSIILVSATLALALAACSDDGGPIGPGTDGIIWGGDAVNTTNPGQDATLPGEKCESDAECPADRPICAPSGYCFQCTTNDHCGGGVCMEGFCVPAECGPGEKRCLGETTSLTCNDAADGWNKFKCIASTCENGECVGCTPGAKVCQGGNKIMQCANDGNGFVEVLACPEGENCLNGECITCFPGAKKCNGNKVETCNQQSQWGMTEDCSAQGKDCALGTCVSACFNDLKSHSNSGCDYWAIDLDNLADAADGPFAVVVANLSEKPSDVTIETKSSADAASIQVAAQTVQPGQLHIFELPSKNMNDAGTFWTGYRIQSSSPIVAYQFNPLENIEVYSNDASLLIPSNTFGKEYFAVSRFEFLGGGPEVPFLGDCQSICGNIPGGACQFDPTTFQDVCVQPYRGFISVLAAKSNTTVTVRPTCKTLGGNGMNSMFPGTDYTYQLEPFQVLNILSDDAAASCDLTGTKITADKNIGVFSGHQAAITSEYCCADHLEQQMFPTNTWGTTYMATKSYTRSQEKDYWRVVAATDGTQVSFDPPVMPLQNLSEGEYIEFSSDKDFKLVANKPVLLAQFLASSGEINPLGLAQTCTGPGGQCPGGHTCVCHLGFDCYCEPMGDPALILAAPVEQYRDEYVFLSPNKYLEDYINVIAPVGAQVTLDGGNISAANFTTIGGTGYMVARLKVADGVHTVKSDQKVSVIAYGYDDDVSYGYTAGLNLQDL
jgi:hypothetical protein